MTSIPATAAPTDATFATPEDAIRAYLAGVASADLQAVLAASAIDEMSRGFHFDLYVDRLKAMQLVTSLAPATSPMYIEMNRAQLTSRIDLYVRNLTWALLSTEPIDGTLIVPADKARADAFAAAVDPARLAGLKVLDIRFSNARFEHDARNLANNAQVAAVYGADEMTERLVLFSFEGSDYSVGFTLLRYGASWMVSEQVANLAGTTSLGTPLRTTVEDYQRITSGG